MMRWFGWAVVLVLATFGLVVLAGQEPIKVQSGVYLCSAVESPTLLQVEGIGVVRLIGVQAEGTPKAIDLVKRLVEGKLVRIEVCLKQPQDEQGRVRAEVFYAEKGQWHSLNRRLIREGLGKLVAEPDCHINFAAWQPAKPVLKPAPVAQRERRRVAAPPSLRAVTPPRRPAVAPQPIMTRSQVEDLALRTIAVPAAFRDALFASEQRMIQASANLNAWREVRWRIDTLQRALLPVAAKATLTPWRFSQLVLRGQPSPLVASELTPVLSSFGGEPIPQRIIRLGLTKRKETLAELLNWFPDIRQTLLQRLRTLGAQLVGGAAAPTAAPMGAPGGPGMMGGPGGPPMMGPGMMGPGGPPMMMGGPGGPPMMGPGMMGGPGGMPPVSPEEAEAVMPGGSPMGAPTAPPGAPPGAPPMAGGPAMMGAPGGMGATPAAAGAASNFYRYLEMARTGMLDPEFAAICFLSLEAYREQVDEQIRLASAEYQRAREEWAELKEIIVRELKKLAGTPLRR